MTKENAQNSSSSIPSSTGWNGKLEYKPGFKEMEETILQINQKDIFNHDTEVFKNNYSANILFRNEYGDNTKQPKRVPNSFMMMKSVVKLIANDKNINCQDGKYLSQMCGLIWRSASREQKYKFRLMAMEFERCHKNKFKHYKYSPPKRSPKNRGTIFEIKTPEYYQPGRQAFSLPHQMNEMSIQLDGMTIPDNQASNQFDAYVDRQDSTFPQQLTLQLGENQASTFPHGLDENQASTFPHGLEENQASTFPHGLDEMGDNSLNGIIEGFSFESRAFQQPEPTIAVNCPPALLLDPNARQAPPIVGNNHPLNPSSTFGNRGMNGMNMHFKFKEVEDFY